RADSRITPNSQASIKANQAGCERSASQLEPNPRNSPIVVRLTASDHSRRSMSRACPRGRARGETEAFCRLRGAVMRHLPSAPLGKSECPCAVHGSKVLALLSKQVLEIDLGRKV